MKASKIFLTILVIGVGLLNFFILIDIIITGKSIEVILTHGYSLIVEPTLILLSIPSSLFQFKTLKLHKLTRTNQKTDLFKHKPLINKFSWFGNLLYAVAILIVGLIFLKMALNTLGNNPSILEIRFLMIASILTLGIWILLDQWKYRHFR